MPHCSTCQRPNTHVGHPQVLVSPLQQLSAEGLLMPQAQQQGQLRLHQRQLQAPYWLIQQAQQQQQQLQHHQLEQLLQGSQKTPQQVRVQGTPQQQMGLQLLQLLQQSQLAQQRCRQLSLQAPPL